MISNYFLSHVLNTLSYIIMCIYINGFSCPLLGNDLTFILYDLTPMGIVEFPRWLEPTWLSHLQLICLPQTTQCKAHWVRNFVNHIGPYQKPPSYLQSWHSHLHLFLPTHPTHPHYCIFEEHIVGVSHVQREEKMIMLVFTRLLISHDVDGRWKANEN